MLMLWSLLTVTIDIIGQSIIVHVQYIHCVLFQIITLILSLHCHFGMPVHTSDV